MVRRNLEPTSTLMMSAASASSSLLLWGLLFRWNLFPISNIFLLLPNTRDLLIKLCKFILQSPSLALNIVHLSLNE